jgi:tetratricopeptide (TPR) repeat protein
MEKEPSQRYSSVNEIITEIDSYQQGFATHAENAGLLRQLQLMIKRHKVIFSAAALIFCILSLGLLLFIKQQENNFSIISAKEKTAREALNKYEMERNEKLLVQAESASRYFFKAEKFFQDLHFKKALEEVNKALLFKPDMKNSNALKAKILLAFYRIEEAIPYFKKADQYQKGFFRPLTDFCLPRIDPKTGRLNHDDYLSLIKMTPEPNTVVKYMMEDVFAQKMKRQERLRLVREILLIRNPEITQLNFTFNEQENSLSLKDNPSLTNIDSLKFSKISNLNLSNTAISSLERIKNLKLQGLNISKTYISTLDELKKMPLTHLNISNTGITDIDSISQLPLTHLNIHNTRVTNLSVLQNMPSLIEVKANWHQFPQDKIKLKGVAR